MPAAAIAFHSYSKKRRTEALAQQMEEKLKEKGYEVTMIEIRSVKRPNVLSASFGAMKQKEVPITNEPLDLSGYDLFAVGGPVWAWAPPPAVHTFINHLENTKGTRTIIFGTCDGNAGSYFERVQEWFDGKELDIVGTLMRVKEEPANIDSFMDDL